MPATSPIIVLGNLDGVHCGHRALLQTARALADERRTSVTVWTFDTLSEAAITPFPLRQRLLREAGADTVLSASFAAVKDFSPRKFVEEILRGELHAAACVCGYNYSFGKGGIGTPSLLASLCEELGIACHIIDPVTVDGEAVSSTRIRALLRQGRIEDAEKLLGHPYLLVGKVVRGNAIGRTLRIPTVNLLPEEGLCLPKHGVYAAACRLSDGTTYPAVTNIGERPTVADDKGTVIETHLLDFEGTLYGKEITVALRSFLREERKFPSLAELKQAIDQDILSARSRFYHH